jgi:hypothetical protein
MNTIPALFALAGLLSTSCASSDVKPTAAKAPALKDNQELARLCNDDQEDRKPKDGKPIDWLVVGPKDEARRNRVMEVYLAGELKTGRDYFHAGLILQHGESPQEHLLCHELCVAAVFMSGGDDQADWVSLAEQLAALSEDRFLLNIGRAQRFGTQFKQEGTNSPWRLEKMEEGVTDDLRKAWHVPSLVQAKAHEAEMNKEQK